MQNYSIYIYPETIFKKKEMKNNEQRIIIRKEMHIPKIKRRMNDESLSKLVKVLENICV